MILRPDQDRAVELVHDAYAQGFKRPILVMPTGSGKTICSVAMMMRAVARGRRCLFLARQVELLEQCERTFRACGLTSVQIIQADRDYVDGASVLIASIPTLVTPSWIDRLPDVDFVVWDECHGVKAATSLKVLRRYSDKFHLGLTATPARGDNSPLSDVFDTLVVGGTIRELTDLGHLTPCRVYAPSGIQDPRTLALDPVDAYERYTAGQRTVVFASTVEHAAQLAESFRVRGIRSEHVSGSMRERPEVISRYAAGDLDVLVNVNLLVQGWDDPATSAAIFARRFTYPGPYLQAIGRILRRYPSKTQATVVDLCGSALVHGTPDMEREYSLDGAAISKAKHGSIFRCSKCGGVSLASPARACTYCGHVMPLLNRAKPKTLAEELHEITKDFEPREWLVRHARGQRLCIGCAQPIYDKAKYVFVKGGPSLHPACAFAKARKQAATKRNAEAA